jgi:hypothetical protein
MYIIILYKNYSHTFHIVSISQTSHSRREFSSYLLAAVFAAAWRSHVVLVAQFGIVATSTVNSNGHFSRIALERSAEPSRKESCAHHSTRVRSQVYANRADSVVSRKIDNIEISAKCLFST